MPLNPLLLAGALLALAPIPAAPQGTPSGLPDGAGKVRVESLCLRGQPRHPPEQHQPSHPGNAGSQHRGPIISCTGVHQSCVLSFTA